ncbi:hypothetical protein DFH08DRAFT_813008 [Mycena albidolilacea]|uniref:Uncharacterized protein n=1 Tax=Mycena albidolilacea TaxID=1033008 RepID=A0AAD6ZUK9_9AGAR|nr:hypothetical protein DFH08DRAFT_813008 [Mycena albidolilacea]
MSAPVADIFAPAFTDPTGLSLNMIHYNERHPILKRVNKRYFHITRTDGSAPIIFDARTIRLYADYCVALDTNGVTPVAILAFYEEFARQMNKYDTCDRTLRIAVTSQFKRNADRLKDQEDMRSMNWYEKRKSGKGKGQPGGPPDVSVPVNSETGKLAFTLKRKEADLARAAATESLKRLKVGETASSSSSSPSTSSNAAAGPSGTSTHPAAEGSLMQE